MKRLFLLGDSTCADKKLDARPETGWGEMFAPYLEQEWIVVNCAFNGFSTLSCLKSGTFSSVLLSLKEGDAVLIEFGHNDQKKDERGTDAWGSYIANLIYMASRIKEKKAFVYFLTSVPRRNFQDGHLIDTHGDYVAAMKAAGHQVGVPVLDITYPMMEDLIILGEEESRRYYMNFSAGIYPNYMEGKEDNTHLRPEGAAWVAGHVAAALSRLLPRPSFLREDL